MFSLRQYECTTFQLLNNFKYYFKSNLREINCKLTG